ncbi:glycerol kinase [Willisornis vidua]|uniref:Glycerol kinase n=1 Tax=Willisornis vidua TaxID=1566151 RepID=A0ABQ9DSF9_9PASS|nr:glycerol kinase [Willisornis vidua]
MMGDFNYPDICWRSNKVNHKLCRRFLESIDNFLTQVMYPTKNLVLLDLILRKRGCLGEDLKIGDSLGCNDHEIVEFTIRQGESRGASNIITRNNGKAIFSHFSEFLGRIQSEEDLQERGIQECSLIFKDHFLQIQEQCISMTRKSGKGGKRTVWMNKEHLS